MGDQSDCPPEGLFWGVASAPLRGQTASGDMHLVEPFDGGVLVAVADALGHGEEAFAAVQKAIGTLKPFAHEPPVSLLQRCHEALIGSRGAVVSLASFQHQTHTMTWIGVGDVEGTLLFADPSVVPQRTSLILRGGIVGARLQAVRPWVIPVSPGDVLIFTTDGIRAGFASEAAVGISPQHLAESILARWNKETDDALVLVARYCGRNGERT